MKPHKTIRQMVVHPKDKTEKEKQCGVVYSIPCANCDHSYIGETGRQLGVRIKEHREDVTKNTKGVATRTKRKESVDRMHKSAITDHSVSKNHVIDWENTRIKAREDDTLKRGIKEAIWIRKEQQQNMNRDEGRYTLSHTYDTLLMDRRRAGGARLS